MQNNEDSEGRGCLVTGLLDSTELGGLADALEYHRSCLQCEGSTDWTVCPVPNFLCGVLLNRVRTNMPINYSHGFGMLFEIVINRVVGRGHFCETVNSAGARNEKMGTVFVCKGR